MSAPKPTLGYTSRTEAVAAMRRDGLTTAAIAARLGVSRNAVTGLVHKHRLRTDPESVTKITGKLRTVTFPLDVWQGLRGAAARRDLSVDALICELVARIVADDLFNAVLDDGTDAPRRGRPPQNRPHG